MACLLGHFDAIGFGARRVEGSAGAFVLVEDELNQFDSAPVSGRTSVISRDESFQNGCCCWIELPSSSFAALPELVSIRWRFLGQFHLSTLHLFQLPTKGWDLNIQINMPTGAATAMMAIIKITTRNVQSRPV
jgi:hypothetical protein